ncbi:MAG: hypothetical protein WAN51_11440 [Alphaproteobacteria bacterium]
MSEPTQPPAGVSLSTRFTLWILGAFGVLALALSLRYGFFQSRAVGKLCLEALRPSWCTLRDDLALIHTFWIWGWLGLTGGALGFWFGWRWALKIGLAMSLMGLVVYNTELGAIGLLLTLLGLVRSR